MKSEDYVIASIDRVIPAMEFAIKEIIEERKVILEESITYYMDKKMWWFPCKTREEAKKKLDIDLKRNVFVFSKSY